MGILEDYLKYAIEIGKFILIFRYFLGMEFRREKWRYGCVPLLLLGFAVFLRYYRGNYIFEYLIFIMAEMYLVFQERAGKLAAISIWLASVIGVLDGIARISIWILFDVAGKENFFISAAESCITIFFVLIIIIVIKRKAGKNEIRIHLMYYLFFSVLGLADSLMMSCSYFAFESMDGDTIFYFPVLVGVLCMYIQMGMVMVLAVSRDEYKEKDILNRKYLKIQEEQYDYLKKKEEDIRKFRHDVSDHILILRELCEEGNYDELKDYIKEIGIQMHIDDNKATTGNGIVDAIVNQYLFQAGQEGVDLKIRGGFLDDDKIESYDYCVIFSNLLRNAVEAARDGEKKRAELVIAHTEKEILIRVQNDYKGKREEENGRYITTKTDKVNHGIGLQNVRKSVEKYHGIMKTVESEGEFIVIINMKKQC